jgi:hypothetical protein
MKALTDCRSGGEMMAETETKKQEPVQVPVFNPGNLVEINVGDGVGVRVFSSIETLNTVTGYAHSLMLNISRRVPTNSNEYTEHR